MELKTIKDTLEGIGSTVQEMRESNDARFKALEKGDHATATALESKIGRIETDLTKFLARKAEIEADMAFTRERIEELEARRAEPRLSKLDAIIDDHEAAFGKALRAQFSPGQETAELKAIEQKYYATLSGKSVSIATGAAGGFAVPESIGREIERLERKMSPVRDLVKVVPVGTSDYKELVSITGAASGWVGEAGTRSETGTPTLRECTPTHGEVYAYPQASEWSLDDMFFDVGAWLQDEVADEFAYQEGAAVISGNGTNKPTGMLNTAPVSTADAASPLRAAAAYQFVSSTVSPAGTLLADSLIDVVYALNRKYRAGAGYAFNSTTAGVIRKMKDTSDQYLWQPGMQMGEPNTLNGYPVATWEDVPDIAANAHPVVFGNFKRGYLLADRIGIRITVDQVTNPGFIRFYVRRREGGIPLNNDALKWIKTD